MNEFKTTGGAIIGFARSSWPFATLTVDADKLILNATIMGKYVFTRDDIVSFMPYSKLGSNGFQIHHKVAGYNSKIVFLSSKSTPQLFEAIRQAGFYDNGRALSPQPKLEITALQTNGGYPLKISATIVIAAIWNLLFILDFLNLYPVKKGNNPLGTGAQLAAAFIFLLCLSMLISEPIGALVLKPGRDIKDIKTFLYFVMLIMGLMFVMSTLIPAITHH